MVNNIKDNTISEINAKIRLSTLNKIKNSETKQKRLIPGQKELLNLFNDIISTDKTLISSKDENEKLKEEKKSEKLKEEKENEKLKKEKENEKLKEKKRK